MTKLVSVFSRILTHRWLLLLVGLLCISALIWFLGPLIQIGEIRPLEAMSARLLTILALIGLWGANGLRLAYQDRRRNKKIKAELDRAGDEFADSEFRKAIADEIDAMSTGFAMTLRKLKRVSQRGLGDQHSVLPTSVVSRSRPDRCRQDDHAAQIRIAVFSDRHERTRQRRHGRGKPLLPVVAG